MKKRNVVIVICGALVLVLGVCLCLTLAAYPSKTSSTAEARAVNVDPPKPTPTATPLSAGVVVPAPTDVPPPTVVPPTVIPTPDHLTVGEIMSARKRLTDLQRDVYDQDVVGEVIWFKGSVQEVTAEYILLDDKSPGFHAVSLLGVPTDVAITLDKGALLSGTGTVVEVNNGLLGLLPTVRIEVTALD